jgi:hypothetical protein
VYDPRAVRRRQRARRLDGYVERLCDGERCARRALPERLALDELRGDDARPAHLLDVVDGDDVRVVEREDGLRLLLEATRALLVSGEVRGQKFQRHLAVRLRVERQVDLAHPARADLLQNTVRAEGLPGERLAFAPGEQTSGVLETGALHEAPGLVVCEEGFDLAAQPRVAAAGFVEECPALGVRALQS